jgi:hypothetical protein
LLNARVNAVLPQLDKEDDLQTHILQLHFGITRMRIDDKKILAQDKKNNFHLIRPNKQLTYKSQEVCRHGLELIKQAIQQGVFSVPITTSDHHLRLETLVDAMEDLAVDEDLKREMEHVRQALGEAENAAGRPSSQTLLEKVISYLEEDYSLMEKGITAELEQLNEQLRHANKYEKELIKEKAEEKVTEWKELQQTYLTQIFKMENYKHNQLISHLETFREFWKDSEKLLEQQQEKVNKFKSEYNNLCEAYDELQAKNDELADLQVKAVSLQREGRVNANKLKEAKEKLNSNSYQS